MNKLLKKITVLALTGMMTVGMNATVFGAELTPVSGLNTNPNPSDTPSINLLKNYEMDGEGTSPAETFEFNITRYGLWNVGQDANRNPIYTTSDMPLFKNGTDIMDGNNTIIGKKYTIQVPVGAAQAGGNIFTDAKATIQLEDYAAVGDYWYKVEEVDGNVAGVIYGTNDEEQTNLELDNGNHKRIYYMHVQVINTSTNDPTGNNFIRTVTLHKTAPNSTDQKYQEWSANNYKNTETDIKKVNNIENTYYAGKLIVKKEVEGNAGDVNKLFKVKVKFTNNSGGEIKSDITCKDYYANESATTLTSNATSIGSWDSSAVSATKEFIFWVKDGTTVTFENIPYGVEYEVTETRPVNDTYEHEFNHVDPNDGDVIWNMVSLKKDDVSPESGATNLADKWNAAKAVGSITDASDTVEITNTKTTAIDVGVITSNAPYIAMLILAAAALLIFANSRKKMFEE